MGVGERGTALEDPFDVVGDRSVGVVQHPCWDAPGRDESQRGPMTEYLSLRTIAAKLDTTVAYLRYLVRSGQFPAPVMMGSHSANWVIEKEVLDAWMHENRHGFETSEIPSSDEGEDPIKEMARRGFTTPDCRV